MKAPYRCDVTPLNETAPHGLYELCTLSSAQPLVQNNVIRDFMKHYLSLAVER